MKGFQKEGALEREQIIHSSSEEVKKEVIVVQIYVDDIIFSSTSQHLVEQFVKHMSTKFE